MFYRPDPNSGTTKFYLEPYTRSKLPYRTVKEMSVLYPNGDFVIVGEIGGLTRPPMGGDVLLTYDGRHISISARGSLKRPFEWIAGYIPLVEKTYVAAVCSIFHSFLRSPNTLK